MNVINRAFKEGWGAVIAKTVSLDAGKVVNVTPRYAKLYSVDALIGGFRSHPDSLGLQNLDECHRIHEAIVEQEIASLPNASGLMRFRAFSARVLRVPALEKPWRKLLLGSLAKLPGVDRTPIIRHRNGIWVME